MFKNFHNSLNNLEYQYSVRNSLLHLLCNFQVSRREEVTTEHSFLIINTLFNALYFRNERAEQLWIKRIGDRNYA